MNEPLGPPVVVETAEALSRLAEEMRGQPAVALDSEGNSLYAYREHTCLVQASLPSADFVIDPIALSSLAPLADALADPSIEKIFHAAEQDLYRLKRDFGLAVANVFDTMVAARLLGYREIGLANLVERHFGTRLDKRHQRANWGARPLTPELLHYARLDTHYLLPLRDALRAELLEAGRLPLALEEFHRVAMRPLPEATLVDGLRKVRGAADLGPRQQAVLHELARFRDDEARRRDRPLFKVLEDRTLVEIAQRMPGTLRSLRRVQGMTDGQLRRYGRALLESVAAGRRARPPRAAAHDASPRFPRGTRGRLDALLEWRKAKAQEIGVESDVVLPRETALDLAERNPGAPEDLERVESLGPWRRQTYGAEILKVLEAASRHGGPDRP